MAWSYRNGINSPLDTGSMIYIAALNEEKPWMLASEPRLLTRPILSWENMQGTINNEGPHPFVTEDCVYLSYSGGAANGYTYVVGMLTADPHDDLSDPANWHKSLTPVLHYQSVAGEYGPGHNSFFATISATCGLLSTARSVMKAMSAAPAFAAFTLTQTEDRASTFPRNATSTPPCARSRCA